MVWTPGLATVWGARGGETRLASTFGAHGMPAAGEMGWRTPLQGGGAGAEAARRWLLSGLSRGSSSYWYSMGHPHERRSRAKPRPPVCLQASGGEGIV